MAPIYPATLLNVCLAKFNFENIISLFLLFSPPPVLKYRLLLKAVEMVGRYVLYCYNDVGACLYFGQEKLLSLKCTLTSEDYAFFLFKLIKDLTEESYNLIDPRFMEFLVRELVLCPRKYPESKGCHFTVEAFPDDLETQYAHYKSCKDQEYNEVKLGRVKQLLGPDFPNFADVVEQFLMDDL